MTEKNTLKGVLLVALGATSYGMLATFVKIAYSEGFTTAEVTVSQFVIGLFGILIINCFQKIRKGNTVVQASTRNKLQLIITGTSTGLTSIFYYIAVHYIPVSIAIVLLMQTVWIGVLVEMIIDKKLPSIQKGIAVVIVLIGTFLATNLIQNQIVLDWHGIVWGLLAALSFTATMFTANSIATQVSSAQRSLYMLIGGAIVIFIFAFATQHQTFNYAIFYKWGIIMALFGTIIPPILLNAGFPLTGIGLGSIVASLELPVSVLMAYFILNEIISPIQWFGIALILAAIVIMNLSFLKKK
jgi:drug/metabolite transporter (DMT)-like permease